jgi:hypothetical protein
MLTLLLVGMWPLSFGSQPAPTQQVSELLLYSDKDIYVLQENITIVVENIGNKTVNWVGRCPVPWDIFTYPDEECVFTAFPCFCIFDLAPGENVTYVWNQCDFFTIGSVEPGMYVVRDNQGWGLMAYFKIVDTEIVVPYDYATIQEAINNANEGDIIFVGKGTYYEHVELYKSVSLVGEDRRTTIVEGYYTHRSTVNITANYAKVAGFTIRNTHQPETPPFLGWGVEVGPSTGVVIEGNMFSELAYGVCAECSKLLAINDNEMTTIGNVFPVGSVPTLMVSDDVMTTPFEAAIRLIIAAMEQSKETALQTAASGCFWRIQVKTHLEKTAFQRAVLQ